MAGIITLIIVLIVTTLVFNTISYFVFTKVSFLRMLIMWVGIKKEYGEIIKEKGLVIKPYDITYEWGKTPYDDFVIELRLIDKVNRSKTRYSLCVDKKGKLIEANHKDNYNFLRMIGLKEVEPRENRRRY